MAERYMRGLTEVQERAAHDALHLLTAADLCCVMVISRSDATIGSSGGILSNMNSEDAQANLGLALAATFRTEPISLPEVTRQ